MAFPTTGLLDNFNRADNGSTAGASWTMANQLFGISGNALYNATGFGYSIGYWNVGTFGPNCEVYTTYSTLGSSGSEASVWARMTDPNLATFTCYGVTHTAVTNNLRIRKFVSGSGTDLTSVTVTLSAGDKLGVEVLGSSPATINAYKYSGGSWTLVSTTTDSDITGSGYVGVTLQNSVSRFDDFSGGTVVAGYAASASVTGTATLTAAGSASYAPVASVSGTATVTAAGSARYAPVASVSGTATLSAAGAASYAPVASITGAATLTATASAGYSAVGNISGSATVTATGSASYSPSASVSGTATLTATGSNGSDFAASVSGVATVTASANATYSPVASVSGTASVSATGSAVYALAVSLSGTTVITAMATASYSAVASVSGVATVSAAGSTGDLYPASASVTGTAVMVATGSASYSARAAASAVAVLVAVVATTTSRRVVLRMRERGGLTMSPRRTLRMRS